MAHININIDRCKGCMLCAVYCPKKLIKAGDKINKKGYLFAVCDEGCTGCGFCYQICPDHAIKVIK